MPRHLDGLVRHLAPTARDADALIDLSNVVRNDRFGDRRPRSLDRLRLVVEALAHRTSDREVRVHALADRSLRHAPHEYPDRAEPRLLADWIGQGLVTEVPDADEPLLDLADVTGLPVVSGDDFKDFRLVHPWIQGNTTQFLGMRPGPGPGRSVELYERDMGVRTPAQISRKIEESDLKAHGLLEGRHRRGSGRPGGFRRRPPVSRRGGSDRRRSLPRPQGRWYIGFGSLNVRSPAPPRRSLYWSPKLATMS
ncbi:hypothetical protein [Streptomyces benahoarensis]|uniref:Uncharacterized protein n=1 Tax=Streptomyces benahoarensis TaxID=2595054 RepID=A0A553ZI09_9ACTN|nr:hypothetical protein [Streptomyces benahoarensis]TSB21629.1 hypothetical protein FNJ62_17920 [Streptomyces benahoarensis]TSB41112.1 hypothetical protein FNZ23_13030 [Streptomyces benahoarensis]